MIIVCFIYFDNSLFWPLYGYISNAKTFLFSYVRMKKSPFQVGKYQRKNQRFFFRVNCVKIVCLSDIFNRPTIGISVVLLSLHYKGPRVLRPLMIGISAVVYFFASTGNFPCKYNNQLKLVRRMHKKINTN